MNHSAPAGQSDSSGAPQVLEELEDTERASAEPHLAERAALRLARLAHLSRRAGWLAAGMLLFGFVGGYGAGYGVRKRENKKIEAARPPLATALAPIVKGLHLSPDGKMLALTAVYDQSRRSSRVVLDVESKRWSGAESPGGWQDFVLGWSLDERALLLRRERIPRPAAEAKAGFYKQKLLAGQWPRFEASVSAVKPDLPRGEKVTSGFWDDSSQLVVRTRREPKSLYAGSQRLDTSPDLYLQTRIVRERSPNAPKGRDVLYAVRNSTSQIGSPSALFRVQSGRATRLSEDLPDLEWAYVAENGRWMIAARYAPNRTDWIWTLYQVTTAKATRVREATIPGDVIGTYWAPDFKSVLGAVGESLWLIDIPTLACHKIGDKKSANADDAAWSADSRSVFVAVDGKILKFDLATSQTSEVWRFPDQYWN